MTVFLAIIKNGNIHLSEGNALRFSDFAKKNEGNTLRITHEKTKRSLNQNAYYFLYLGVISRETGDDVLSLHEFFKRTFLPPKFIKAMGKEIKIPKSTTELTKTEFGEYLDRIAGMTSVPLPDREEAGFYYEK